MAVAAPPRVLKALVLSGGKGSRLRPFTYTGAKQLVPVANKPILFYALEDLVRAGVRDIGIVVGDTREEVMAAVGDGGGFGARISYVYQERPLGIAHTIILARDFLAGDPFVLYLGDNFLPEGISDYAQRFRGDSANCQVLLSAVPNPQDFGIAEMEGGQLRRVVEKPCDPPSDLAVIGIYMFDDAVQEAVQAIQPSARGELEITDAIQYLLEHGADVRVDVVRGPWIDTGKMDDILLANRLVLERLEPSVRGSLDVGSRVEGRVVLEEGSRVENSLVRGPAIIGRETRIVDSYVGPFTSVYHHCLIEGSEVAGSVVLENTTIRGMERRIEDSLIGRNVRIQGDRCKPRTYRLVLGDFSQVDVP
jgi:glucose-1-phosphate thymidylyltransferase